MVPERDREGSGYERPAGAVKGPGPGPRAKARETTLTEIAERITAHLRRFDADPEINETGPYGKRYYMPGAHRSGARIRIAYKSFQHPGSALSRADAIGYLAWLDAGNVGTHFNFQNSSKPGGDA